MAPFTLKHNFICGADIHYQQEVMQILLDYARAGHAVMIAIHDLSLAARYCDRLCLMDNGRIVITDTIAAVLNSEVLSPVFNVDVYVDLENQPPVGAYARDTHSWITADSAPSIESLRVSRADSIPSGQNTHAASRW